MNVRQCFLLIAIILPAFKITMLPGYLNAEIGRDAWIAVAISMLADLLILACILYVNRKGGMTELLTRLFGKPVATVISLLVVVFMTVSVALKIQDPLHYMINMLFDHNEKTAIVLPLALVAGYVGYKSARSLGRLAEITAIFAVVPAVLSFAFTSAPMDVNALEPVLVDGFSSLSPIKGVAIWFGDYLPLLFVRLDERSEKRSGILMLAGLIGTALTVMVFVLFTAVYQGAAPYIPDALVKLARYNVLGSEVGRLDVVVIFAWLFCVILAVSLVVNAISRATSEVWQKKGKTIIVTVTGVMFFVLSLFIGGEESVYALGDVLLIPILIFHLIVPVLVFLCAVFGTRKKEVSGEKASLA